MNRIRDQMRGQRRRAETTDPGALASIQTPQEERGEPESAALGRLRAAMNGLPEADREIVELRHHGGMSFKQMAELLGEPLGTLLARHHRALKKLKQLMGGEESVEVNGGAA